ncbi:MAG: enoyl-CoA hydratase/isomerase family protein [Fimbriimonadales bacterium]|nr:enoyl-CoA hydratase/isomerase family protein [Fimbriimonadales bacterium]MDW8052446.1 enoyl-CoA hydratase/isomerase family protein [Armatimonadota bacterium]
MAHTVTIERTPPITRITLNRPEVHNAFNETLIAELTEAFEALRDDDATRVVVLQGAGKSFCAGADLNWMGKMVNYSFAENLEDARALARMFETLDHCPKPVVGRIHGAAIGGGAGLVAVCDVAIATPAAQFAFSEVKLGLIPAVIAPYVLRKIGYGNARALFITGERFSAETALRIGLIHRLVPEEQLDAEVDAVVQNLLQNGPNAMTAAKMLLHAALTLPHDEFRSLTIARIAELRVSEEGQEGIRAFLEKRKPKFGGGA